MSKIRSLVLWSFPVVFVLSGCVSGGPPVANGRNLCDPDVSKMGPNTYLAKDSCGGGYALDVADRMCNADGREILVTRKRESEIIFQCLKPGQTYQQPTYEKDPNVIIQDRRR